MLALRRYHIRLRPGGPPTPPPLPPVMVYSPRPPPCGTGFCFCGIPSTPPDPCGFVVFQLCVRAAPPPPPCGTGWFSLLPYTHTHTHTHHVLVNVWPFYLPTPLWNRMAFPVALRHIRTHTHKHTHTLGYSPARVASCDLQKMHALRSRDRKLRNTIAHANLICRYTGLIRSCFPLASTASLSVVGCKFHAPLHFYDMKLFAVRGSHTHTPRVCVCMAFSLRTCSPAQPPFHSPPPPPSPPHGILSCTLVLQ